MAGTGPGTWAFVLPAITANIQTLFRAIDDFIALTFNNEITEFIICVSLSF